LNATLTIAPVTGHPHAIEVTLDCTHGHTVAVLVPLEGTPTPMAQIVTVMAINHELEEGCGCAEAVFTRYGQQFAAEHGVELPPFGTLRQNVAAWLAAVGVMV
jgi:hypothetical protein